jgi:hypothetical protein
MAVLTVLFILTTLSCPFCAYFPPLQPFLTRFLEVQAFNPPELFTV